MNLFSMLAMSGSAPVAIPKTKTFNANESWPVPAGVTMLTSVVGKGQDGTAASSGQQQASVQVDSITGYGSGTGSSSGSLSWNDFNVDNANARNAVNAGGNGTVTGVTYDGYPNSNTYNISLRQDAFSGAVAGTAIIFTGASWKPNGPVVDGDYGYSLILYTQVYSVPKTVGASASGFGRTFAGGDGGAAQTTTYNNVPVTPLQSYNVIVPSGGTITITYYE